MKILIACEESQEVCKAFRELGHEAFSCDILPCSGGHPEWHIQDDVLKHLDEGWDLIIAHPPCTYLSVSGLHWNKRNLERAKKTEEAISFVKIFMSANVKHIAIENPVGCLSSVIRKPEQIINPFQFGADASKKTCLWLKNLPILKPTQYVEPRIVDGKKRWANQSDDGQNVVYNSEGKMVGWNTDEIKLLRSKTYPGIAKAMATQWNEYLTKLNDGNDGIPPKHKCSGILPNFI
jgi:hypothetical protein